MILSIPDLCPLSYFFLVNTSDRLDCISIFFLFSGNRVIEKMEFKAVLQILGIVNHNF